MSHTYVKETFSIELCINCLLYNIS